MAFAGVDLHKSYCQAIVCTSEGEVLKEGRIPTEKEDIEGFFSGLERLEIALEAARIHVQWCPESKITKHYEKLKRKRGEKIAIVAAARKLLQAIYYMPRNNEPFRIEG